MNISLTSNGLDDVLKLAKRELYEALESKRKRVKDQKIYYAIGVIEAAYKMYLISDDESEVNEELAFHGNLDKE